MILSSQSTYFFGTFYSANPEIKLIFKSDFTYELRFIHGRCTRDFIRTGSWKSQQNTINLVETGSSIPSMCMGATGGIKFISNKQDGPVVVHNIDSLSWRKILLVRTL